MSKEKMIMSKEALSLFGGLAIFAFGSAVASSGQVALGWAIAIVGVGMALALGNAAEQEGRAEWERKRLEALQEERDLWR
jgi:multisubunit Na+/H+ antiporter MnhG subunit